MELFLLLVLMMGVGIGSAAAAWSTRRPEMDIRMEQGVLHVSGTPTPKEIAQFREFWDLAFPQGAKAPSTPSPDLGPTRPDPGKRT